jgi:hypothetical protein
MVLFDVSIYFPTEVLFILQVRGRREKDPVHA